MVKKELQDKTLKYVHGAAMDFFGVDLTDDQIIEIGKLDRNLWNDLKDDNFDTVARDNFADALVRFVLGSGRHYPRNGDGKAAHEKFEEDFKRAAQFKGIKTL